MVFWQDAEKIHQWRSRFAQKLNVPKRTPRIFACCGLACGMARLGAPGLGGLRCLAFFSILPECRK